MEAQEDDKTMISKKSKISRKFENSSQIKAILFDMDGVLLSSFEAWLRLFNKTLKHFGKKEITKKEFIEKAWAQDIGIVANRFFKGIPIKEIVNYYFYHFLDCRDFVFTEKDVYDVLNKLKKKGLKLVVVSNTYHRLLLRILNCGNLEYNFNLVVGADDVKKGKPEPDMLLYACKKLKIKPEEAAMVGDTEYDMIAAKKAKCLAIGFKTKGDKRIESLKELLRLVR